MFNLAFLVQLDILVSQPFLDDSPQPPRLPRVSRKRETVGYRGVEHSSQGDAELMVEGRSIAVATVKDLGDVCVLENLSEVAWAPEAPMQR